jgi:hypothetical protein
MVGKLLEESSMLKRNNQAWYIEQSKVLGFWGIFGILNCRM